MRRRIFADNVLRTNKYLPDEYLSGHAVIGDFDTGGSSRSVWGGGQMVGPQPMGPGTGGSRGGHPSNFETGGGRRPSHFDEKMHLFFFLFGIGIFEIKWPKSEEKFEFGGR